MLASNNIRNQKFGNLEIFGNVWHKERKINLKVSCEQSKVVKSGKKEKFFEQMWINTLI